MGFLDADFGAWKMSSCFVGRIKGKIAGREVKINIFLLLIEEILHHLGCVKSCN